MSWVPASGFPSGSPGVSFLHSSSWAGEQLDSVNEMQRFEFDPQNPNKKAKHEVHTARTGLGEGAGTGEFLGLTGQLTSLLGDFLASQRPNL